MQKIKIKYTGFWKSFDPYNNIFQHIIEKKYKIELSEDPDFVICSPLGRPYEYIKYDCPRIMYTGEFLSPDFSAIDYFIGFDYLSFGDRCLRYPLHLYNDNGAYVCRKPLTYEECKQELQSKQYFCNYIFGHQTALGKREEILSLLSKYKRIECAGKQFNNMPDNQIYTICTKKSVIRKSKFTIAFESVNYPGFVSEKISDAFKNYSIPIYYGDPLVEREFNPKAFFNCEADNNLEESVAKIIEVDQNDELYLKMLSEYQFTIADYEKKAYEALSEFLLNIMEQGKEAAYRRPRYYRAGWHETYLKEYNKYMLSLPHRVLKKFHI